MHILRNVNEKIAAEKKMISAEWERCKEQKDKLETQFTRLKDSFSLEAQIDSLKVHIDSVNRDLYTAQVQIKNRDDSISKLKQEINALNIALDNHAHYDKSGKNSKNGDTLNRETLRDMCLEMAKRQAELHNMSVTLADVFAKLEAAKKTGVELTQDRDSYKMQLDEALNRLEILEGILEEANAENIKLNKKNNALNDVNGRLQETITDLGSRNSESRQAREDSERALTARTEELYALKEEYKLHTGSLQKKLDSAIVTMAHNDQVMALRQQQLSRDLEQLSAEREIMKDKLQRVDYLEREIDAIRSSSSSQIEERESEVSRLQHDLRNLLSDLEQYRRQLSESSEKVAAYDQLIKERDTLSSALRDTMAACNGLKAKLQHEINKRQMAETATAEAEERAQVAEEKLKYSEQSKSHYTLAILDEYQRIREKLAITETELNQLRASGGSSVKNMESFSSRESRQGHVTEILEPELMPPTPPASPVKETRSRFPLGHIHEKTIDPNVAATHDVIGNMQRYFV